MKNNNVNCRLRMVNENDKELLLEWANDKTVRYYSFSQNTIQKEQHEKWFERMMADPDIFVYILMCDDDPIGQCRLNISDETAEISYSIDKNHRGLGYGKVIIRLIVDEVSLNHKNIKSIVGKVKKENDKSKKCFEDNGFFESYCEYEYRIG